MPLALDRCVCQFHKPRDSSHSDGCTDGKMHSLPHRTSHSVQHPIHAHITVLIALSSVCMDNMECWEADLAAIGSRKFPRDLPADCPGRRLAATSRQVPFLLSTAVRSGAWSGRHGLLRQQGGAGRGTATMTPPSPIRRPMLSLPSHSSCCCSHCCFCQHYSWNLHGSSTDVGCWQWQRHCGSREGHRAASVASAS